MKILQLLGIKKKKTRRKLILQQGDHHNLNEIYMQVNERYFEGKLHLTIGWVGNRQSKPRTRVMFGSYNQRTQNIKIHRRLDRPDIPVHFIAFIIYHEMLHHVLPPIQEKKRRNIHHPAFIAREKQFSEYDLVTAFREEMKRTWFRRS